MRKTKEQEQEGFYEAYASLSRTFRAWLVAFGVGAPLVFLSRDATIQWLRQMPDGAYVIVAFLLGVLVQVFLAWLYKLSMWWAYMEEMHSILKTSRRYRFADWFTSSYWIEGVVDLFSIGLYAYGTARLLLVMAA
jgi:hypothetical protein